MNDFIFKQTRYYHDYRGLQKVMLQMMPSEPLVGEPVAVVREKSEEDLLLERKLKREEQQRLEAEKEARSVIPLNECRSWLRLFCGTYSRIAASACSRGIPKYSPTHIAA